MENDFPVQKIQHNNGKEFVAESVTTGMSPFERLKGSYTCAHFGSSSYIGDEIAAAYVVRKQIAENIEK